MSSLTYTEVCGFEPFFNSQSRLLILGSFPSVKSRLTGFYYGNPQNKFWKFLSEFFSSPIPVTVEDKKEFLSHNKIALWDVVCECRISGSSDASIRDYKVADIRGVLSAAPIERILLNGGKAYEVFVKHFKNVTLPYVKLPSTSPANTGCSKEIWFNELSGTFNPS